MSVSKYRWTEACEGQPCPGDCDLCSKEPEAKNDDLISRQAAIDVAKEELDNGTFYDIPSKIKYLPPAHPEIIRCKDCKHYDGRPCGIVDWYNTADDFCSRAERMEGER